MPVIKQSGLALDHPPGVPLIGYQNQIEDFMLSATTAEDGHPASYMANPATHLFWRGELTNQNEYITISSTGFRQTDYLAIAGHNFGSANIGVYLIGYVGSSPATAIDLIGSGSPDFVTIDDDTPIIMRFTPGTYSSFLLTLKVGDTPAQIAVMYNEEITVLERGIKVDVAHTPITYGLRPRIVNGLSESGNFLGRIVLSEGRQTKAEFFGFSDGFFREVMLDFMRSAQSDPFFWAYAPDDYEGDTGFVWLIEDAVAEQTVDPTRIWALTLNMAGITV